MDNSSGISVADVMQQSKALTLQTREAASKIMDATNAMAATNAQDISAVQISGAADGLISSTKSAAEMLMVQKNAQAASTFGTNQDSTNEALSAISSSIFSNSARADAALARVREKQSVNFLDDPVSYLSNMFTVNSDIRDYNQSNNAVEQKSALLADLQARTTDQYRVNAGTAEVTTAASAQAQVDKINAATTIMANKVSHDNLQYNIQGIESVNRMNMQALSIQSNAIGLRNQEAELKMRQAEFAFQQQRFPLELAKFKEEANARAEIREDNQNTLDRINIGLGTMGKPRVDLSSVRIAKQLGGSTLALFGAAFEAGGVSAQNGKPILGATPASAGTVLVTNNVKSPVAELKVATLVAEAVVKSMQNITLAKDIPAQRQNANDAVSAKLNGTLDPTTGKRDGGWISNVNGHDETNIYNAPDLKSLSTVPAIANTQLFRTILAPQIAASKDGVVKTNPEAIINQGVAAVASGQMSWKQLSSDITTIFGGTIVLNNATANYEKYGVPPQTSFNVVLPKTYTTIEGNTISAWGKERIDLTNPTAVTNYLMQRAVRKAPTLGL